MPSQYAILGVSNAPWVVIYTAGHVYLEGMFIYASYFLTESTNLSL